MGFFSSIGSVLGGVVGSVIAPGLGTVIGSGLGGALGGGAETLINKNNADNKYSDAMGFAQSQYQFQQDYIKNAMQWRAEDAKKAGYHPMAALGFSSPSFSPVSAPQYSGYTDSNTVDPMEFGQSLNYASAKAKTQKQQETAFGLTVDGMRLDNQGKQIQNEIAATELLSMQAQLRNSGPASPVVNAKESQGDASFGNSFSPGTTPLLSLSRVGNTLMGHINPDISDSLTEDMIRNQLANFNAEIQAGRITPEVYSHLTKKERELIKKGDLVLEYSFPSSWRIRYTPRMRPKYSNDNREAGGRLNFYHMKY